MRQRALRATLDWSHNLLDPEQQKLFRRMSVFVGGATHEAIEAVCNAKEDLDIDLLDAIESLVDNSLVRRTGADLTEPRFVMLETMREYGLGRLAEAGEEAYTRKAHAAYCVVLAEEAEPALMGGPGIQEWFQRIDAEIGNIRAALDWLIANGRSGMGRSADIGAFVLFQRPWLGEEAYERCQKLLALPAAAARNKLRAKVLGFGGQVMAQFVGRNADRRRYLARVWRFWKICRIRVGTLRALAHNAVADRALAIIAAARTRFERAVEVARQLNDPAALAGSLSNLADLVTLQGEFELARLLHLETARLFEDMGDRTGVAWSLSHQADLARQQKDSQRARSLYEQALSRFRTLGNQAGIASCHHDLAGIAAEAGDHAAARRLYGESLKLYWDLGNQADLPRVLESCAACATAAGEPERALTLAGSAAALRQALAKPLTDSAKTQLESSLEEARRGLTSSAAMASWMRGWTMQAEEAVQFAVGSG